MIELTLLRRFDVSFDPTSIGCSSDSCLDACAPGDEKERAVTDNTEDSSLDTLLRSRLTSNPSGDSEPGRDAKGDAAPALLGPE